MADSMEMIRNVALSNMVIPGTHNAAAYRVEQSFSQVKSYVICQEENIFNQLAYGIR